MDISDTLAPNSDQLDAIDLVGGPRVFVIERVERHNDEQPINIHLADFPRPWRPGKSMRRVLAACWGTDASQWPGRAVELYCDPTIMFGKDKVGGTRLRAMSHIDGPKRIPLLVSRGKSAIYVVEPLPELEPARDWTAEIAGATTEAELRAIWQESDKGSRVSGQIKARKAELAKLADDAGAES